MINLAIWSRGQKYKHIQTACQNVILLMLVVNLICLGLWCYAKLEHYCLNKQYKILVDKITVLTKENQNFTNMLQNKKMNKYVIDMLKNVTLLPEEIILKKINYKNYLLTIEGCCADVVALNIFLNVMRKKNPSWHWSLKLLGLINPSCNKFIVSFTL